MEMVQTQAEARFREAQDALPAHARVARAAAMFVWARGVIGREILARSGPQPAIPAAAPTSTTTTGTHTDGTYTGYRLMAERPWEGMAS